MASLGQSLREERETRNISIEEIAAATKIVPRYLEALENDRFDIMPGGFFIKGIIRAYARAIGLNEEEVLARYRAAGAIGEPEPKRHPLRKPAPEPTPRAATIPPAEADLPPAPKASLELVIEEAPRPKLSPAARKRIFTWVWRAAASILAIAVVVVLWPSRRPRKPQAPAGTAVSAPGTVATRAVLPPPQKTAPGSEPPAALTTALTSVPSSEPGPTPSSEPPPVVEEAWKGVTIEISFHAETWIQVYTDGVLKIDGLFPAGTTARAQADERLLIHVGNAGGFTFLLNGKPAKPLGRSGQVLTDIKITPENYRDFLEGRSPGQPAGCPPSSCP